jgi:hypothetical protein
MSLAVLLLDTRTPHAGRFRSTMGGSHMLAPRGTFQILASLLPTTYQNLVIGWHRCSHTISRVEFMTRHLHLGRSIQIHEGESPGVRKWPTGSGIFSSKKSPMLENLNPHYNIPIDSAMHS